VASIVSRAGGGVPVPVAVTNPSRTATQPLRSSLRCASSVASRRAE